MKKNKNNGSWYFLLGVIILYAITFIIDSSKIYSAMSFFTDIILKIIPILIFMFILMVLTNYFIGPKTLVKYLGKESGIKGWFIAIISGILSEGPIYIWYPMLKDLKKQGMRTALIATFLYNRAIKIPLFPLLIAYFGLSYSLILVVVMIIVSILQGLTTEKIIEVLE